MFQMIYTQQTLNLRSKALPFNTVTEKIHSQLDKNRQIKVLDSFYCWLTQTTKFKDIFFFM